MYNMRANLVIGFHGCDESTRDKLLLQRGNIEFSREPFDWLGHGMYFWENNLDRAWQWAEDKKKRGRITKPAVIGAVMELMHCCDLLDERFIRLLISYYKLMKSEYITLGKDIPENKDAPNDIHKDRIIRDLDCSVIEYMHDYIREHIRNGSANIRDFDSTRGVFTEGGPAFPGAGIFAKSHIQTCIRNPNCIKGFFLPRDNVDFPTEIIPLQ